MNESKEIITIKYGDKAAAFPLAALEYLERASKLDLKILIGVSACVKLGEVDPEDVIKLLGITEKQFWESMDFWCDKGLIEKKGIKTLEETSVEAVKVVGTTVKRSDEIPCYTSSELAVILERRTEASHFIDECQRLMGKIFNTHDINVMLGLVDYMGLEWDYVTAIAEYCGKIEKRSVKYAEKIALSMLDMGIDNAEALQLKLEEFEKVAANEGRVRNLFGMKARAFTSKEKKFIEAWFGKYGYNIDIVTRAYEITVNATGEASLPYANAILERWDSEGLRNIEEIDLSIEKKKNETKGESGSFDTDDFFEAALKRSLENK